MTSIHFRGRQQGFGILDVLITVLVLAVALLSLGGLHSTIIKSGSLAKARTNAGSLTEEKLDDLRAFADNTADSTFAYTSIATGSTSGAYNTIPTSDNVTYTRNWYVYDFNMCTDNAAPTVNGTTCTKSTPDMKLVTMVTSWTDESGTARKQALQSAFANVSVANSAAAYTPNYSGAPDFVLNTSYVDTTSDPVSETVGNGITKRSTQPVPDTNRTNANDSSYNTITTFTEQYYDTSNKYLGGNTFVTINCNCKTSSSTGGYLPSYWSGSKYISGNYESGKASGVAQSNQEANLCTACCRDHNDNTTAPDTSSSSSSSAAAPLGFRDKFDPFRPYNSDYSSERHKHYNISGSSYTWVQNNNNDYVEACRMAWNNGRLQPLHDWRLADLRILPSTFLNTSANVTTYANYVVAFVEAYFDAIATNGRNNYPSSPPDFACTNGGSTACSTTLTSALSALNTATGSLNQSFSALTDTTSYTARGIYVDYMQPELYDSIYCKLHPGSAKIFDYNKTCDTGTASNYSDILYMIPFHDVNVQKLAHWSSSNATIATVTDATITDQNENSYTRGVVTPASPLTNGTSTITLTMSGSNSGITDTLAIDNDDASRSLSRTFTVTVSGVSSSTTYTISGTISLASSENGGTSTPNPTNYNNAASGITVTGTGCTTSYTSPTVSYTCTGVASGSSLTITVKGYTSKSGSTTYNNCLFDATTTNYSTRTISNDGTATGSNQESTAYAFVGVTANKTMNFTVKSQQNSSTCP